MIAPRRVEERADCFAMITQFAPWQSARCRASPVVNCAADRFLLKIGQRRVEIALAERHGIGPDVAVALLGKYIDYPFHTLVS